MGRLDSDRTKTDYNWEIGGDGDMSPGVIITNYTDISFSYSLTLNVMYLWNSDDVSLYVSIYINPYSQQTQVGSPRTEEKKVVFPCLLIAVQPRVRKCFEKEPEN